MKDANFIPAVVRLKLRVEADIFRDHWVSFYQQCMAYLDKWCQHFRDMESFKWISLRSCPSWDDVKISLQLLSRLKVAVDDVQLIEEVRRVSLFVTATKLKVWKEQEASTPSRWTFHTRRSPKFLASFCAFLELMLPWIICGQVRRHSWALKHWKPF